ncbi:hypothetical protein HanRHA438_Chr11g0488461 [Helianthus annuus]|uniref:Uncharacterized protein n=1 Tax=Helianthus annuus TaxID=4232 RepID=A0A9K3HLM9_HELAN|nr:hypothetical protein HanXRQr2_Chr11g0475051 [Helianthus annuus]KAJ0500448.1 hypothetical protein HanHA300_Chr11g0389661 [Helianthus annuus]KAJ0688268.1 hypothetical protein HanOQP8_Chr11g0392501 [Helianthus annuus]KAJ0869370.1 hypothetical protein HanRHA438_Chr11g0488461 [Helianthus annuus]KAJ0873916.1 hypothetical protein HanPSC8_Chr11g0458071 [Helianthus annuus]
MDGGDGGRCVYCKSECSGNGRFPTNGRSPANGLTNARLPPMKPKMHGDESGDEVVARSRNRDGEGEGKDGGGSRVFRWSPSVSGKDGKNPNLNSFFGELDSVNDRSTNYGCMSLFESDVKRTCCVIAIGRLLRRIGGLRSFLLALMLFSSRWWY